MTVSFQPAKTFSFQVSNCRDTGIFQWFSFKIDSYSNRYRYRRFFFCIIGDVFFISFLYMIPVLYQYRYHTNIPVLVPVPVRFFQFFLSNDNLSSLDLLLKHQLRR
jgi:hypothetical protein